MRPGYNGQIPTSPGKDPMSSLNQLRMVLWSIRNQLTEHPIFSRRAGLPVDDSARNTELTELDEQRNRLGLVLRELNNRSNLLSARTQNLWNIAPQDRFRARSSIRSQTDEVNDVLALAREVQSMLDDMLTNSGLITLGDAAKGLGESVTEIYHHAHEAGELLDSQPGLFITKPQPNQFAGSVEGVTITIYVTLQVITYLAKRVRERGSKLNIDKVVKFMDAHAHGVDTYGGRCAGAVHQGLEAGGLGWDKERPRLAKDNGPWLVKHGATVVGQSATHDMPAGYKPEKGDVAVFQGGPPHNPIGHMAIYDGAHWVSDTIQSNFSPSRHYPGGVTIYRFPQ